MANNLANTINHMQIESLNILNMEDYGEINAFGKHGDLRNLNSKVIKSLYHWNKTFKFMRTETSVILAPINKENLDTLQMIDVVEKAIQLQIIGDLTAIHILPHKSFFFLNFKSAKSAADFQNSVSMIKGKKIFYVDMESVEKNIHITIDKIPAITLRKVLPNILNKYGKIINIRPTLINIKGSDPIETSPVMMEFELNKQSSKEDFPHYIFIDTIKVYLLVKGKPNICFICDSVDHLASECKLKYCERCKKLKAVNHTCVNSYAYKLKLSLNKIGSLIEEGQMGQYPLLPEKMSQNKTTANHSFDEPELENNHDLDLQYNEEDGANSSSVFQHILMDTDEVVVKLNEIEELSKDDTSEVHDMLVPLEDDTDKVKKKNSIQKIEDTTPSKQPTSRSRAARNRSKNKNAKKFKSDSEMVNKSYLLRSDNKGMSNSLNPQVVDFMEDGKSESDTNSSFNDDDDHSSIT